MLVLVLTALLGPALAADGDLGSPSPATLHWQVQDIPVLKRVAPAWPAQVPFEDASGGVACRTTVRIDGEGVPFEVGVEGCPDAFAAEARRAASGWRWAPLGAAGERRVTMNVRFTPPAAR